MNVTKVFKLTENETEVIVATPEGVEKFVNNICRTNDYFIEDLKLFYFVISQLPFMDEGQEIPIILIEDKKHEVVIKVKTFHVRG